MLIVIFVATFIAVTLAVWGISRPRQNVLRQRIRPTSYIEKSREGALEGSLVRRVIGPMVGRIGKLLAKLVPQNVVRSIGHMLVMAGEPMTLPAYLTFWAGLLLLAGLVISYVVLSMPDIPLLQLSGIGLFLLGFAAVTPYVILHGRVQRRQKSIRLALPDALDLLVSCMEAGVGVDAAFTMVGEKTSGTLSEAFALYLRLVSLGRTRRDALAYVAERTGVPELIRIAAAVSQAEEVGTTLGDVMRAQAEDLRLARRSRAQEAAHRAPVLMTIPLVFCFLPAMGVVVTVPALLNLIDFIGGIGSG